MENGPSHPNPTSIAPVVPLNTRGTFLTAVPLSNGINTDGIRCTSYNVVRLNGARSVRIAELITYENGRVLVMKELGKGTPSKADIAARDRLNEHLHTTYDVSPLSIHPYHLY